MLVVICSACISVSIFVSPTLLNSWLSKGMICDEAAFLFVGCCCSIIVCNYDRVKFFLDLEESLKDVFHITLRTLRSFSQDQNPLLNLYVNYIVIPMEVFKGTKRFPPDDNFECYTVTSWSHNKR